MISGLPYDILSYIMNFLPSEKDCANFTSINKAMVKFRNIRGWRKKITLDYQTNFYTYINNCEKHSENLDEIHLDGWDTDFIMVYPRIIRLTNITKNIKIKPLFPVRTEYIHIQFNHRTKKRKITYDKHKFPKLKKVIIK